MQQAGLIHIFQQPQRVGLIHIKALALGGGARPAVESTGAGEADMQAGRQLVKAAGESSW